MPKYVELSVTDVVHESEIFGAFMPPKQEEESENKSATEEASERNH